MELNEALQGFLISLEGAKSGATVRWYQGKLGALVVYAGAVDLAGVTAQGLREWRAALVARGLSSWTVHGHVRAARRFFAWLVEEELLVSSPARRLELPELPYEPRKGISEADMRRMVDAARGRPRDYALVLFLADTGCRVGGLCGLRVQDLELERGRAMVREKGRKARTVFLEPGTCWALRSWLFVRPAVGDHVFVGKRGPLTGSGVYQVLRGLARQAGVADRWNPHSWRHGVARAMLGRGANLAQVSQILGHSDVSVTVRFYGSFVDAELQQAHARYGWLAGSDSAGDVKTVAQSAAPALRAADS